MITITAEGIGKRYKGNWVFRNLNHNFKPGSRTAILGANGSGKSTLLKTIIGYAAPSEGALVWQTEVDLEMETWHTHYAFAAPYLELFEEHTLDEMLAFHFELNQLRSDMTLDEVFEMASLTPHRSKTLGSFSSGMLQRVKLIMALCSEVDVYVLDEPCSNLDDRGYEFFSSLIKRLPEGKTVIIASNDPREYEVCATHLRVEDFKA